MKVFTRRIMCQMLVSTPTLAACASASDLPQQAFVAAPRIPLHPNETPELRGLINKWADHYDVPRPLVHRLAIRESTHNVQQARNGPYLRPAANPARHRTRHGVSAAMPAILLDPDVNLKYGVKYLRGAWLLSDGDHATAIKWYARGYYYEAKRQRYAG